MKLVELFATERALAIIRTRDQRVAADAMDAAIRGGFRIIEFTLNTPGAMELIDTFARRPDLIVGAGTVVRVEDAVAAGRAGARFLVSPIFDENVAGAAARSCVPLIPGVATPTEAWRAHRAGVEILKLFPVPVSGPAWVRSVLAPMPFLHLVPTNGVDANNAGAWLDAGCLAVGSGAYLFPPDVIAAQDWGAVEQRARSLLAAVRRG